MPTVAAIIPYFQRSPGILRRALTSILCQELSPDVRVDVIVVDDGSPVPARAEIHGLEFAPPFQLHLTEQPNGGVAAARNAGLHRVTEQTSYIPFLDSDDTWHPAHLATAIAALDQGYDLYYCDSRRIGQNRSAFNDFSAEPSFQTFLSGPNARRIGDQLYDLQPAALFSQTHRHAGFRIPAIVYRRAKASGLSFDTSLREVGEDSLFILRLILASHRVCCCIRELVSFGEGVNIYESRYSWENPGHLIRHMGIVLYYNKLQHQLPLAADDAAFIAGRAEMFRRVFAFLAVRYFRKKRELWPRELIELTRCDPGFWWWFLPKALYVAAAYPLRLYDPFKSGDIHQQPALDGQP
jgi:succinoglycan biosynthesis protein ExoW